MHTSKIIKCKTCGKEFMRRYNAEKHCSVEYRREYYSRKEVKDRYRPPKIFVCVWCGKEFEAVRKRKYCSDGCRAKTRSLKPSGRTKPTMTIEQVALAAREAGLSYGQYVAKYGL